MDRTAQVLVIAVTGVLVAVFGNGPAAMAAAAIVGSLVALVRPPTAGPGGEG